MAYRIVETQDLFFGSGVHREYYKEGRLIAVSNCDGIRYFGSVVVSGCDLSRAQGYRYWEKYFSGCIDISLPAPLQVALDKPCVSYGEYYDKKTGELIGWEG